MKPYKDRPGHLAIGRHASEVKHLGEIHYGRQEVNVPRGFAGLMHLWRTATPEERAGFLAYVGIGGGHG